jgi:hypothetical protein
MRVSRRMVFEHRLHGIAQVPDGGFSMTDIQVNLKTAVETSLRRADYTGIQFSTAVFRFKVDHAFFDQFRQLTGTATVGLPQRNEKPSHKYPQRR